MWSGHGDNGGKEVLGPEARKRGKCLYGDDGVGFN